MIEVLLPVALGLLGSGMGYWFTRKQQGWRRAALAEADRLRGAGQLARAVVVLEQSLRSGGRLDPDFTAEALYRLAGLYASLGRWSQGEAACQALLASQPALGPSGRHDLLRHLARCLEGLGQREERERVLAEADLLIEQVQDTAYRLYARQERLLRLGQVAEALLIQEELLQHHRERVSLPTLLVLTAFTAYRAGYPSEALAYASEVLGLPGLDYPHRREAHRIALRALHRGTDWERRGSVAEAFLALVEQVQDQATLQEAQRYAAEARFFLGDLAGAEALAEENLPLQVALARHRGALAEVERLLATDTSPGAALILAGAALDCGEGARALEQLDSILPTPDLAPAFQQRRRARRAWALALLGRTKEAQVELDALPQDAADAETALSCQEARAATLTLLGSAEAAKARAQLLQNPALAPVFRDFPHRWGARLEPATDP